MKKRQIAYITGTRADFGLMTPVLKAIEKTANLELQIYATGIQLMPQFGFTFDQVKEEFPDVKKIEAFFKEDSRQGVAEFIGEFSARLVETFSCNRPDFVLVQGDRIEMICIALCCLYLGIPIGHTHGGERTFTVDEIARHSITKMANLHFTATKDSARRIKKMGEENWRIFTVGAPALDTILNTRLPSKKDLFKILGLDINQKIILLTQHPESEKYEKSGEYMKQIISAVKTFSLPIVVIYPNADPGSQEIIKIIENEKQNSLFRIFPSLEFKYFLALEREAAVWIGNSSAMMIESSSFHTPVVNIGLRQKGRVRGRNVIDVAYSCEEIIEAIDKSLNDKGYRAKLASSIGNPWGDGRAGQKIAKILSKIDFNDKLLYKQITY